MKLNLLIVLALLVSLPLFDLICEEDQNLENGHTKSLPTKEEAFKEMIFTNTGALEIVLSELHKEKSEVKKSFLKALELAELGLADTEKLAFLPCSTGIEPGYIDTTGMRFVICRVGDKEMGRFLTSVVTEEVLFLPKEDDLDPAKNKVMMAWMMENDPARR